jgi:hypothetical protein
MGVLFFRLAGLRRRGNTAADPGGGISPKDKRENDSGNNGFHHPGF